VRSVNSNRQTFQRQFLDLLNRRSGVGLDVNHGCRRPSGTAPLPLPRLPLNAIDTLDGARSTRYAPGVAKQISQRELCNNSGEIMRQLDQGESFVLTRNGIPVGELSPLRRHRFISADAAVARSGELRG